MGWNKVFHEETEGLQKNYHKRLLFIEQPGAGHTILSNENLGKALAYLDQPIVDAAGVKWKSVQKDLAQPKKKGKNLAALDLIHGAMFAPVWGAEAKKAHDDLRAEMTAAAKGVEDQITAGDLKAAQSSLTAFTTTWEPACTAKAKQLREDMAKARSKKP